MAEKGFEQLLNLLFESACHSCSFIPEEFHLEIYKGTLHYAVEKLSEGDVEKRKVIVKIYEKWSGSSYDSFDEEYSDSE